MGARLRKTEFQFQAGNRVVAGKARIARRHTAYLFGMLAFAAGLLTTASASEKLLMPEASLVPAWSDPDNLEITGGAGISRAQLLGSLSLDLDAQLAASQGSAPDYQGAACRLVEACYKNFGYADVHVDCRVDLLKDKTFVAIAEGPKYLSGEIQIDGGKQLPIAELKRRLCEKVPPVGSHLAGYQQVDGKTVPRWVDDDGHDAELSDPVWQPGQPISVDPLSINYDKVQIAKTLDDLGYPAAKFTFETRLDRKKRLAAFVLHISDVGPEPVIATITVDGNQINSEKVICDFLGIHPGLIYSGDKIVNWNAMLWRSGRFVNGEVTAEPRTDGKPGLAARINVTELADIPPLDKPLTPEESAMAKFRDWLVGWVGRNDDLVYESATRNPDVKLVLIASRDGMLLALRNAKSGPSGLPKYRQAITASGDGVSWYSFSREEKIVARPILRQSLSANFRISCAPPPNQASASFWFGTNPSDELPEAPLQLKIELDPAVFVSWSESLDKDVRLVNGVLEVASESNLFRFDLRHNLLLEARLGSPKMPAHFEFVQGAFKSARRELDRDGASFPNRFDSLHPSRSIARMIADNLPDLVTAASGGKASAAVDAWAKCISRLSLDPLDDWLATGHLHNVFPPNAGFMPTDADGTVVGFSRFLFPVADQCFLRSTWPWALSREFAFGLQGKPNDWGRVESVFKSKQVGPLCCLAFAEYFKQCNNDFAASTLASNGLTRMTLVDFRHDYRPLVDHRCLAGELLYAVAGATRDLSPKEIDALCQTLPTNDAILLRSFAGALRRHPSDDLAESVRSALDELWVGGWSRMVKSGLESLAR